MGLLKWAPIFLILSGVSALFGFTNLSSDFSALAKVLFVVFLVIFAILGLLAWTAGKAITSSS